MKEKHIHKETSKPITNVISKRDKELQKWEVQSTKGGETLINKGSEIFFLKAKT
jgi:hypothetical protein